MLTHQGSDLYILFFEKGWLLLKDKGILSFITPNTWLQSISFTKIRLFLSNKFYWSMIFIPDKTFDAVVDTLIVIFEKQKIADSYKFNVFYKDNENIKLLHSLLFNKIPKNGDTINLIINQEQRILYEKIIENSIKIKDACDVFNGVKPFEKGKGNPPQSEEVMKTKPFVAEGKKPSEEWSPLLRGSLIQRYKNIWNDDYWILYGKWLAAPRNADIFKAAEKILVRQTGDSIIAVIVGSGFIARDNLHIIVPQNLSYNLKYVLAILNSKLSDFVYTTMNPEKGEALAQVKKQHVENLILRDISIAEQQPFIKLVDKILTDKKAGNDTSALERKIDKLVYQLYGLSEEEILIVEGGK